MDTDLNTEGWYSVGPFSRVFFWFTLRDGLQTYTFRNPQLREDTAGVLVKTIHSVWNNEQQLMYTNTRYLR